jgi:hypothetical protein
MSILWEKAEDGAYSNSQSMISSIISDEGELLACAPGNAICWVTYSCQLFSPFWERVDGNGGGMLQERVGGDSKGGECNGPIPWAAVDLAPPGHVLFECWGMWQRWRPTV